VYRPGLNGFPESCKCKDDYYWYNCDEQGFYKTGCFYRLKDAIFDLQEVMAWVAIGVGVFEVWRLKIIRKSGFFPLLTFCS
jgi:hypothetical protein